MLACTNALLCQIVAEGEAGMSTLLCALQIWNAAAQESSSGPPSRLHSALMAVLTHMVNRLGNLAIQDPHIQGVLYALLQKGLEGSSAEQEV